MFQIILVLLKSYFVVVTLILRLTSFVLETYYAFGKMLSVSGRSCVVSQGSALAYGLTLPSVFQR